MPIQLKKWLHAVRPWSFPASFFPALVAFCYIWKTNNYASVPQGLAALAGTVITHAGGNLISDYHDYRQGVDRKGIVCVSTLVNGTLSLKETACYSGACVFFGLVICLFLVAKAGAGVLLFGLTGLGAALFYYKFKYAALGDAVIFLVYGPSIMFGMSCAMTGSVDWQLFFISFPIVCITVGILHANNIRDVESDKEAHIVTLPMKIGLTYSILLYLFLLAMPYLFILFMVMAKILPLAALLTFFTLPFALRNCRQITKSAVDGLQVISGLDESTAKLQIAFSSLLVISLLAGV